MPLLQVNNLTLGYDSHTVASNISFSAERGDYIAVVGENGAGKSTLIKCLLGLVKPRGGEISIPLQKQNTGYLPQQTEAQKDFPATVKEIVFSGCISPKRAFYRTEDKKKACRVMKELNIFELKGKSFKSLSGGQQQKVLLARALCAANEILIADEPAASLDISSCKEMYRIIESLNKDKNITVITVTHDILSALKFSTHILHISKDAHFFGTVDEYRQSALGAQFIQKLGGDHK